MTVEHSLRLEFAESPNEAALLLRPRLVDEARFEGLVEVSARVESPIS